MIYLHILSINIKKPFKVIIKPKVESLSQSLLTLKRTYCLEHDLNLMVTHTK